MVSYRDTEFYSPKFLISVSQCLRERKKECSHRGTESQRGSERKSFDRIDRMNRIYE